MVRIKFVGHACFIIETKKSKIIVDPFLSNNPLANYKEKDLEGLDLALITHAHSDHLGDSIELERRGVKIVGIYDLGVLLKSFFGVRDFVGMNKGGKFTYKDLEVYMLNASHSSSLYYNGRIYYAGEPASFLIKTEDISIFHAGDSALIKDYEIYPEIFGKIDLVLLPVGGFFTMDINQAKKAAKMLKAKYFIPMHYNTFDLIKVEREDLEKLKDDLGKENIEVLLLNPGEIIEL